MSWLSRSCPSLLLARYPVCSRQTRSAARDVLGNDLRLEAEQSRIGRVNRYADPVHLRRTKGLDPCEVHEHPARFSIVERLVDPEQMRVAVQEGDGTIVGLEFLGQERHIVGEGGPSRDRRRLGAAAERAEVAALGGGGAGGVRN